MKLTSGKSGYALCGFILNNETSATNTHQKSVPLLYSYLVTYNIYVIIFNLAKLRYF